ncbi:hypothetical protein C7S15_1607 [Burkholderia cepacia]|uniref:hypothetical protein n=1 Tax=Burkholderia cepacia TaxID=292 RepID=UPI00298FCB27|nr:hypothetical protein [Burkholderia cepacia]MDW9227040.1 hypothetical protein [Burkholderia cepacia]
MTDRIDDIPAPSPADERATWDRTRHSLAVAMVGFADRPELIRRNLDAAVHVIDALTEPGSPLAWLRTGRAASANETGAEGASYRAGIEAVAKFIDKKAADYLDEYGYVEHDTGAVSWGSGNHADAKRDYHSSLVELVEEVREFGGSRSPAMAAEAVALSAGWKAMPPSATTAMRMAMAKAAAEYMQRTGGNSPDAIYEAGFAAAPQPAQAHPNVLLEQAACALESMGMKEMARIVRGDKIPNDGSTITQPAQADARVGLTAEQFERIALKAAGEAAQIPGATLYNAAKFACDEIRALLAIPQPEPRAEVTHGDTTMGECMASLLDRMEAAELDAARYRYLRERPLDAVSAGGVFAGKTPDNVVLNGADLDAAIDAARAGDAS